MPNPGARLDYVVALGGHMRRDADRAPTRVGVRYVPDRLVLEPAAFGRYLGALGSAGWPSLEGVRRDHPRRRQQLARAALGPGHGVGARRRARGRRRPRRHAGGPPAQVGQPGAAVATEEVLTKALNSRLPRNNAILGRSRHRSRGEGIERTCLLRGIILVAGGRPGAVRGADAGLPAGTRAEAGRARMFGPGAGALELYGEMTYIWIRPVLEIHWRHVTCC